MTVDSPMSLLQCAADAKTVAEQISGCLGDALVMPLDEARRAHQDIRYAIEVLQHLEKLLSRRINS